MIDMDYIRAWATNIEWSHIIVITLVAITLGYIVWLRDPRQMERAMARKKERRDVAQIISDALLDAEHYDRISTTCRKKYNKKLAYALGLPDMEPRQRVDANRVKTLIKQRLNAMGINVEDRLTKLRRTKTKKNKLIAVVKK